MNENPYLNETGWDDIIILEVQPLDLVRDVIWKARLLAMDNNKTVRFTHNSRTIELPPDIAKKNLHVITEHIARMNIGDYLKSEEVRRIVLESERIENFINALEEDYDRNILRNAVSSKQNYTELNVNLLLKKLRCDDAQELVGSNPLFFFKQESLVS